MNARHYLAVVTAVIGSAALAGCSSARDVNVTGSVTSAEQIQGKIQLEFFDLSGTGADAQRTSVQTATLDTPGDFQQTVPLEGDHVAVRAIDDRDGDGKCTAGEPWAEVQAPINADDTVDPITLDLVAQPCPQ